MDTNIWDEVQHDPLAILKVSEPSEELICLTFQSHGTEWFKNTVIEGIDREIIQLEAIRRDPELIRWCLKPSVKVLATAVSIDPKWLWVARAEKKEAEVIKYIDEGLHKRLERRCSVGQKIKNFFEKYISW